MEFTQSPSGLPLGRSSSSMQIILINIVLSGDNAALAGVFKVAASYIRVRCSSTSPHVFAGRCRTPNCSKREQAFLCD